MADDTREPSSKPPTARETAASPYARTGTKSYEQFLPPSSPDAKNILPGGTNNTAGGKDQDPELLITAAAKRIKLEEFAELHKKPCVRDALLSGIGSGFFAGGAAFAFGRPVYRACNWAVGVFCAVSFYWHKQCQTRRAQEKEGMKRAVMVMDEKKKEKRAKFEALREERRKKEEEQRKASENSWYKFW